MINKNRFYVVLALSFIAVSFLAGAEDIPTESECIIDSDCDIDYGEHYDSDEYYCNLEFGLCYMTSGETTEAGTETETEAETTATTTDLESDVASLQATVTDIQNDVVALKRNVATSQKDIVEIKDDVNKLQFQVGILQNKLNAIDSNLVFNKEKLNTVSAGLAGLQENLNTTQTEIASIEETLIKRKSSSEMLVILFLIFLAFAAALGTWSYLSKIRPRRRASSQVTNYITSHITQGKKYPHIKENLRKAGWPEEAIKRAYSETVAKNYRRYAGKKLRAKPAVGWDKTKIISIGIISILLVIGIFFLLRGATGKAIEIQEAFAHDEPFKCTPPHIVTEGGCCLDMKTIQPDGTELDVPNGICDNDEEYLKEKAVVSAPVCHDHNDCAGGEKCIDTKCGVLNDLYKTDCPGKKCNIRKIKILTSDGESYTLHAKKGSYTAAGALAWTIRPVPNYCEGEEIKVPIEIEKQGRVCYVAGEVVPCVAGRRGKSKILSKEMITLAVGQTSEKMTHPNPGVNKRLGGFALTLLDVNEFCFS